MPTDDTRPFDIETAHRVVREYRTSSRQARTEYDPRMAAGLCLRSANPEVIRAGAALLAELADDESPDVDMALIDLLAALDVADGKTRAYVSGTIESVVHEQPRVVIDHLDAIVARLTDPEPLVREAACSTLAQIASYCLRTDAWTDLVPSVSEQLGASVDQLATQIDSANTDEFTWETAIGIEHPQRCFWGPVEAGESRRSYIRWQATYAVALLADRYPEVVATHARSLTEAAFDADQPETRGYAVDALGRAAATDALRDVRDRACNMLNTEATREQGITVLYNMTLESPDLLVEIAPRLATKIETETETLRGQTRSLAATTLLYAATSDPAGYLDTVADLVREWLTEADETGVGSSTNAAGVLADLASNHPDLVLPEASTAVGICDPAQVEGRPELPLNDDPTWDVDRAWTVLLETAEAAPESVWAAISPAHLRSELSGPTPEARAQRLFARCVPLPLAEDDLTVFFKQLLADDPGARQSLSILADRKADPVVRAAITQFDDCTEPQPQALRFLAQLSSEYPHQLEPLVETVQEWAQTIEPSDKRWEDLITIRGRIALANDDTQTIAEILQLTHQGHSKHFLRTSVASELIHSAPNKAVPPLLDHLSAPDSNLRKLVVQTFDDLPGGYGGWENQIKKSILDRLGDDDWQVRAAATDVFGRWLETIEGRDGTEYEEWTETITDALVEQLQDADWRVRRHVVSSLAERTEGRIQSALTNRLSEETVPEVRFEIQRASS